MPIEFQCPSCAKSLRVADESAGKQARCPNCNHISRVPSPVAAAAPVGPVVSSPFADKAEPPLTENFNPYQSPKELQEITPSYRRFDLAPRSSRFVGAILDFFILAAAFAVLAIPGGFLGYSIEPGNDDVLMMMIMLCGAPGALLVAIINWVMISKRGQSIAKRILGIRIITMDGRLPGFVHGVVLRNWVPFWINQACNMFGLIDALWIFGEERRCLHDLIAGTQVINVGTRSSDPLASDPGDSPFG